MAILYTDAEGSGCLGAVVHHDDQSAWLGGAVPRSISNLLQPRKTQIFAYETLMVLVSVSVLGPRLRGRRLLVFVDNTSALGALIKGSSSASDVHILVPLTWQAAARLSIELFFRWVPSKLNLADPPSRGSSPVIGARAPMSYPWTLLAAQILDCRSW